MSTASSESSLRPPPLPNLTALRFFAALLVLGYHFSLNGAAVTPQNPIGPFLTHAFLGVPLFFVLSGFVLAYSHPVVRDWRQFYVARIARIYPLALFALILVLPFAIGIARSLHQPALLFCLPVDALLLQSWIPPIALYGNPPAWTLSVEVFFYLMFPVLLPFVVRHMDRRWLWIVGIWLAFLVLPVLADYPLLAAHFGVSPSRDQALRSSMFAPPYYLGEFLMGMFGGARFRRHPRTFGNGAALGCTLLCLVALYFARFLGYQTLRNSGIAIFFLLLIYTYAGWPSRLLASRPLQIGGEISFSMYLLQYWVLEIFLRLPEPYRRPRFMVPVVLGLSWLSYSFVEKPGRQFLLRRFHIRAPSKPLPTPATIP